MERQLPVLCPSSTCSAGALLLGIVLPNQTIAYVNQKLRLDAELAQKMHTAGGAEKRFRFSSPCVQKGCHQWASGKCGVIEEVLSSDRETGPIRNLPACSIRAQCRWYVQRGAEACHVCQYVVTDTAVMTEDEAAELVA